MYEYNAKVLRVVDGDTVDVLIDVGFSTFKKERVRLHGINTPECRTRDLERIGRQRSPRNPNCCLR
jgi:micrococcal nuclease